MKEAIILAGGFGKRIANTINNKQKVMAAVGGRPFLEYLLEYLSNKGFEKIVLAVSYNYEQIKSYFSNKYLGLQLVYSIESEPLGTGGAIKKALSYCKEDNVAVFNGDTFFDIDLSEMISFHNVKKSAITVGAKYVPDCSRHGYLVIDSNDKIIKFSEKDTSSEGYINGGVYIINKAILDFIKEEKFSFEKDVLEKNICDVYALKSNSFFIDIGIPSAYFRANTEVPLLFNKNHFRAAFLDRDGVICVEKHHLYKKEDFEFTKNAVEAIEKLRELGYLIFVITNQAGVGKGYYTENDVITLHEHMISLCKDKIYFDGIYYCPYHENAVSDEYKKISNDRKPGDGMIKRAVADFLKKGIIIDLENSILIGDKLSDILAGKKAGVGKNILVRSGHKIDENTDLPDMIFDDLYSFTQSL